MQVHFRLKRVRRQTQHVPTSIQEPNSQPRSPWILHNQDSNQRDWRKEVTSLLSLALYTQNTSETHTSTAWDIAPLPSCDCPTISIHRLLPVSTFTKFPGSGTWHQGPLHRMLLSRSPWLQLYAAACPKTRMALSPHLA